MSVWQAAVIFVSKLKVSKDGLRADLRAKEADLEARVVQLRAKERELLGKDTDISRLLVELQSCQTEMLRMQVCVCVCVCACHYVYMQLHACLFMCMCLRYVTRSEKTDHVLHATKNETMIVFISTSFLLYSSYQNLKPIGAVVSEL